MFTASCDRYRLKSVDITPEDDLRSLSTTTEVPMLETDAPYPPMQGLVLDVSSPKFRYHQDMPERRTPGGPPPDTGSGNSEVARVVLEAGGKITLPAAIRKHLGVTDGDLLVLDPQPDGTAVVVALQRVVQQARGILSGTAHGVSVVDELIAERREEARREGGESER
jgi:bifunctional DNA-binding transcriptional regulator/antitoxin component of YhaV-PrlF toxin-antitoxin module